ncbi:Mth938-like domain-containing protein [Rhizorhapis sp. SPR117]|uniref:Mth938-like domain-containing protein n=1 Tax=Rhizorhapis sp. SPR117 TaxID=2912611 RepID=UPI001F36C513|nr:MTH938/NDUFAF3 family protein [Rhizorhapis sp. SPR117]
MMELHRDPDAPGPVITGFSGSGFRVQDTVFPDGLMLTPDRAVPWNAPPVESLGIADVADLIALDPPPEFLLLGTGGTLVHPPRAFVRSLEERGIGVEAMDSRAAARAWGVLRAEERWIVATFLPL